MTVRKYILDGKTPVPCDDLIKWAKWFETAGRQLRVDRIGAATVSTIFLGVDHRHSGDGPPLLFETMIFGGKHDRETWRCSTWDEALAQHNFALAIAKCGLD